MFEVHYNFDPWYVPSSKSNWNSTYTLRDIGNGVTRYTQYTEPAHGWFEVELRFFDQDSRMAVFSSLT